MINTKVAFQPFERETLFVNTHAISEDIERLMSFLELYGITEYNFGFSTEASKLFADVDIVMVNNQSKIPARDDNLFEISFKVDPDKNKDKISSFLFVYVSNNKFYY